MFSTLGGGAEGSGCWKKSCSSNSPSKVSSPPGGPWSNGKAPPAWTKGRGEGGVELGGRTGFPYTGDKQESVELNRSATAFSLFPLIHPSHIFSINWFVSSLKYQRVQDSRSFIYPEGYCKRPGWQVVFSNGQKPKGIWFTMRSIRQK